MPVAYSPVGRMGLKHGTSKFESIDHPLILSLAQKYKKKPVQILLAWGLRRGYSVIPKASSEDH